MALIRQAIKEDWPTSRRMRRRAIWLVIWHGLSGGPRQSHRAIQIILLAQRKVLDAERRASKALAARKHKECPRTAATLSSWMAGEPGCRKLTALGGREPYVYGLHPDSRPLPAGLALDRTTGALSGTPTAAGTFHFVVEATDAAGFIGSVTCSITIDQAAGQ